MSKHTDEELKRLFGIQLPESDPREFAKYHRLIAFDLGEVYAVNATVAKFVTLEQPIHQGFYGADVDHTEMLATGVLGWRVPALRAEIAIVKYEGNRGWLGRKKSEYALFVGDGASCYLATKGATLDAATPMLVRGFNGLGSGT